MSIRVCDRCGDVTLDEEGCTCRTSYNAIEVRRRHQVAVATARTTTERARPQSRTALPEHPAAS
jgi:hypothetical protein